MSKKRSCIWDFYQTSEDSRFAVYNSCSKLVSRGGKNTKTYNTTNLVHHLKATHPDIYAEYSKKREDKAAPSKEPCSKQLTFEASIEKTRKWDHHALCIHNKIGQMIALDYQPFFIVDDVGFNRLLQVLEPRYKIPSRKYFTETVLPNIYERTRQKVESKIKEAKV